MVASMRYIPTQAVVPFDLTRTKDTLKKSAYQVVVVKFGGNAIGNDAVLDALVDDTIAMVKAGIHVIVVHGGGTAVNDALAAVGKETKKLNGLRVTDEQTLAIAVKVFTDINNTLIEKFRQKGASALGFCSRTAIPFQTQKMSPELGWVGEIVDVNAGSIERWMAAGWIPVVSPLGMDGGGHYYNINADHAALALATSLDADGLIFMTDVPGVLKDFNVPHSRIGHVTPRSAQKLIAQGTVTGGMLPKIKSCVEGINSGISRIAIINSFEPNALIKGFVAPQETGTLITGDKYDH
ncbi:MAG: acetylglutamate kinase [Cyanobacteria bacterium SZAS LIN-2]|nr:acetylglutamate kinase [Cyanobacteria bacterium SZAS LIN-3]MBS1999610.1 acetylglutamate kinase [Cyanobacteria bacterium SZAS LIN-2]